MRYSESSPLLTLDTSVLITVLAIEGSANLLAALKDAVQLPVQVWWEVQRERWLADKLAELLNTINETGIVNLTHTELQTFNQLVSSPVSERLSDGEAASIALAVHRDALLAIEGRKARRIIGRDYPSVTAIHFVDLFDLGRVPTQLAGSKRRACIESAVRMGLVNLL